MVSPATAPTAMRPLARPLAREAEMGPHSLLTGLVGTPETTRIDGALGGTYEAG